MSFFQPLILLLSMLSAFGIQDKRLYTTKWVITERSSLKVSGTTNVNKFGCEIATYSKSDTLVLYRDNDKALVAMKGFLKLNLKDFDCNSAGMSAALRKTLKSKQYPHLVITFLNLSRYPLLTDGEDAVNGNVMIELSGVSRHYNVTYSFINTGNRTLTLTGKKKVYFSDFNITPPKKVGGIVKTKNALNIEFNLNAMVFN